MHSNVTEYEYHKERARTEESIQGFGCIRRHGWNQEIHPSLIRKGKKEKKLLPKPLRNSKYQENVLENFIKNAKNRNDMAMFKYTLTTQITM